MRFVLFLLLFVPLAILAQFLHANPSLILICSSLGMIPLAWLLGEATEQLSESTGPKVGGLLNSTLGNAAELIITIVALKAGKITLVQASITGSILGNLLLILGFSMLLGGLYNGRLRFDRTITGVNATMMILAVISLVVPSVFHAFHGPVHLTEDLQSLSIGVAVVLLVLYALSIVFTFPTELESGPSHEEKDKPRHGPQWKLPLCVGILAGSTLALVVLSELLVGAVEPVAHAWGISEFFIGIILVPLVGNIAEHLVGVQMAIKNKMDLSLLISLGSSTQIALFVAPLLVLISLFVGPQPMTLTFNPFEVVALGLSVLIASFIALDGESHWLEGAQLLAVYVILSIAFFFMPQ